MDEVEKIRRAAWSDQHAGMRFEREDGKGWTDARGKTTAAFDDDTAWPDRQATDRKRWGR